MKFKKFIIWILVILILFLIPSWTFLLSNISFNTWNFVFSWNINNFLEKYFKNEKLNFKKWDYYYRFWHYDKALEYYNSIECKTEDFCSKLYHNIWNANYRLWERSSFDNEKIKYWQESLKSYLKSLEIKEDKETRFNYDFVKSKLEELIKNQQEQQKQEEEKKKEQEDKEKENQKEQSQEDNQKQNEENQNNEQQENQWNSDESQNNWQKQDENQWQDQKKENQSNNWEKSDETKITPRAPSMWLWWEESEGFRDLSEQEKSDIKGYIDSLKEQEKQNSELNKPQKQNWDIFENFFDFDDLNWWNYDW